MVKSGDGQALSEEIFKISLEKDSRVFYKKSYLADSNGYLEFSFDPSDCPLCDIYEKTKEPEKFNLKVDLLF